MTSKRRRMLWIGGAVATVVVVLFATTSFLSWGLAAHWTCSDSGQASSEGTMFFPAVLTNAPFGGKASGNAIEPADYPGAWGYPNRTTEEGSPATNGTADGIFFPIEVSVDHYTPTLTAGPGSNSPCAAAFQVSVEPPANIGSVGWGLLGEGNVSDALEPTFVNFSGFEGDPLSPIFENGFARANEAPISTCGTSVAPVVVLARSMTVIVSFEFDGTNTSVSYTIPFELDFEYTFPADFGTWQVDNLSAPGGPGGGWAFSYSPCG